MILKEGRLLLPAYKPAGFLSVMCVSLVSQKEKQQQQKKRQELCVLGLSQYFTTLKDRDQLVGPKMKTLEQAACGFLKIIFIWHHQSSLSCC